MSRLFALFFFILLSVTIAKADDFTVPLENDGISISKGFSFLGQAMTDYVQRGISQTYGQGFKINLGKSPQAIQNTTLFPALQAGVTYTFDTGLFVGVSNVNSNQGNNSFENDLTVGWKTKLSDSWVYQLSVNYQNYPGSSNYGNLQTVEFDNIVNYVQNWGKLVAAFGTQPQGQNHSGWYTYTAAGVDVNLPDKFVIGTRLGYNTYSNHSVKPNYLDWTVTVSRPITNNVMLAVQYTGSTDYIENGRGNRIVGIVAVAF